MPVGGVEIYQRERQEMVAEENREGGRGLKGVSSYQAIWSSHYQVIMPSRYQVIML